MNTVEYVYSQVSARFERCVFSGFSVTESYLLTCTAHMYCMLLSLHLMLFKLLMVLLVVYAGVEGIFSVSQTQVFFLVTPF